MHQVHTLNPVCAQRLRALHQVRTCRNCVVGLCQTVSWLVAGRIAGLVGRVVACIVTQPAPRSCASAVSRADLGSTVSRHKVVPLSATIQLLYCDPAPSRTHFASCRACTRTYRGHPVARPSSPFNAPALPPSLACHNTTCCIVIET